VIPTRSDPDLDDAVDAMSAEDLRAFVRDALERLDDEPRADLTDRLVTRAARGTSGWRPFFWSPLEQMERVAVGPLPDFETFLPAWVRHLDAQEYSRFYAFQGELREALASTSLGTRGARARRKTASRS